MYNATKDDLDNNKNINTKAIKGQTRSTAGKVLNLYNSAFDELSHATETVTTQIRTKPVQSSVVALGIGFLIGALMRR